MKNDHSLPALIAVAIVVVTVVAVWAQLRTSDYDRLREVHRMTAAAAPDQGRPEDGFLSSRDCQNCHPQEYASWHNSYHRTMTQLATQDTVTGNFDDVTLNNRGRVYHLEQNADGFFVDMVDPEWEKETRLEGLNPDDNPNPPRTKARVVMTTGSHHMQTYWVAGKSGNEVYNLPFVHYFEPDRWIPREDVFLRPPNAGRFFMIWNNSCIECHSTAGKVGFDFTEEVFNSQVAELGIACEACHGPAEEHVAANHNPLRRYFYHLTGKADPTMVQPERLTAERSSQVCGQCHGVSLSDGKSWLAEGHTYQAGDDLEATRTFVRPGKNNEADLMRELIQNNPESIATRFWSDGMVRVSGREFSGMQESACYKGDLSCLSCHGMHNYLDNNDLLAPEKDKDQPCMSCHPAVAADVSAHTNHPVDSSGSSCINCHMPHTVYGLMTAIRSHEISTPSVNETLQTGRPNACNLCHLDKPLGWTKQALSQWYGTQSGDLTEDEETISMALRHLLSGDAGQRALIAWNMGWEPAQKTSGTGWYAPYLSHLMNDPYATVRYISERSLRGLPDYADIDYDFLADPNTLNKSRDRILDIWFKLPLQNLDRKGPAVLIDAKGNPQYQHINRLIRQRDDRPVVLAE